MRKLENTRGITLIALVITIIVLIILAGVSITMLSGDNSILQKAGEAKTMTEDKGITERVQTAYLSALTTGKGQITQELFETELDKEFGENGYELSTDDATDEWVVKVEGKERYRVGKPTQSASTPVTPTTSGGAGLQADGSFIGLKSIGKGSAGQTDNYWNENRGMTLITGVGENGGYKFTSGHFVHISSYDGWLWDDAENDWVQKTGADVYLCWNADYGTITSEQDLIDYTDNHGITTYWDIFDASSGAWLLSGINGADYT